MLYHLVVVYGLCSYQVDTHQRFCYNLVLDSGTHASLCRLLDQRCLGREFDTWAHAVAEDYSVQEAWLSPGGVAYTRVRHVTAVRSCGVCERLRTSVL